MDDQTKKLTPKQTLTVWQRFVDVLSSGVNNKSKRQKVEEPRERSKHLGSKNKSQKTPKYRRLMARQSNRINRKRIKKWKH